MSKLLNFGTVCGGVSGLVLGGVAVLQLVAPPEIKTPDDLINALGEIEEAIESSRLEVRGETSEKLQVAVESLNDGLVQAITRDDGSVPFVPRTSLGVSDYPHNLPFDFLAGNGESRLIMLNAYDNSVLSFQVDGGTKVRVPLGDNIVVPFGDENCTFEVISIEEKEFATIRSRCN